MVKKLLIPGVLAVGFVASSMSALATSALPSAKVIPARASIRSRATIVGSHLRPRSTIALLLAIPDLKTKRTEKLLGATHADSRGNLKVTVQIPLVTSCGPASIYLISNQAPTVVRARLYLTGCTAGTKPGALPPLPPSPHKP